MRGEPNAVGVPTKWSPGMARADYFRDTDWQDPDVRREITSAFDRMEAHLAQGKDVVIPADGLGTGLAELPKRAPAIYAWLESAILAITLHVSDCAQHNEPTLQKERCDRGAESC